MLINNRSLNHLFVGALCLVAILAHGFIPTVSAQEIPMITLQPDEVAAPAQPETPQESPCADGECPYTQETQTADTAAASSFNPQTLDPSLSTIPYSYAKLNIEPWESAPLYGSAADAAAGANPVNYIPAGGIRYVSYTNRMDIDGGKYVQAKNGGWLRASPAVVSPVTLGRTFATPPTTNFGWVFESCNPYMSPSYKGGINTLAWFNREEVLQVFEIVENSESIWFRVGENQWLDRIHFRAAIINSQPPAEVTSDRWIELDLAEQVVLVYENRQLIYAVMVATGMEPFYTQPGVFQVYDMKEAENMTGSFEADRSDFYSLEDVPFVIYHDQARAFHGAFWRAWFGLEQSHGCINMTVGDAHWLYDWTEINDFVWVHDRTGKTPTDPAFYGAGGA